MSKWIFIFLAAGCFYLWKQKQNVTSIPTQSPLYRELVSSRSCEKKSSCALVYVTPWCPACEQLSPILTQWKEKSLNDPEAGLKIIVGMERNSGDNKRIAERYGDNSLIDEDQRLHELLKIRHYPTIILVRKDGVIEKRDQEAIMWAAKKYELRP
jgi:thiol-disulfide isomerase/thioredoxin